MLSYFKGRRVAKRYLTYRSACVGGGWGGVGGGGGGWGGGGGGGGWGGGGVLRYTGEEDSIWPNPIKLY